MGHNSFGLLLRITTWGESHGTAIGVVVDGCPAGLPLSEEELGAALAIRAPGNSPYTSPRREPDKPEILSGIFEGATTGAPISILIANQDHDPSAYDLLKHCYRPGHANFAYLKKYGIMDHRGGGRASARETACRVAAGAIAEKILATAGIKVFAHLKQVGNITTPPLREGWEQQCLLPETCFCVDPSSADKIKNLLTQMQEEGDSVGGIVEFIALGVPPGLGDPVYHRLDARLAQAMMSIPATKGFEIGDGFAAVARNGSDSNDPFVVRDGTVRMLSNHCGGVLGGISTGMPVVGRVAFKAASSIKKTQQTVTTEGMQTELTLSKDARHDPCVAVRAVPVVRAMMALVLADHLLLQRSAKIVP